MKFIMQRPSIVFIVTCMVIVAGILSIYLLPIKILPVVSTPYINITVITQKEIALDKMEKEVTFPLEDIVLQSEVVKKVDVNTSSKFVWMNIELKESSKKEEVEKLEEEINGKLNSLTLAFEYKDVRQISTNDQSIMEIAIIPLSIQDESVRDELKNILIPELSKIKGIRNVNHSLDAYELDLVLELKPEIITSIEEGSYFAQEIVGLSTSSFLGSVKNSDEQKKITSEMSVNSKKELENYQLQTGQLVGEVAYISEKNQMDLAFFHEVNGRPYYLLQVMVTDKANEVEVSKEIRKKLDKIHKSQHTEWEYLYEWDSSVFISQSIKELGINILFGAIVAIGILLVIYKSIRTVLVIGLSIPVSIFATLVMIYLFGYSINIVTLLGIGIGTGMIVDASIVVLDNIRKKLEEGLKIKDAVLNGTKEVATPVISSILTTAIVFIPACYIEGEIGEMAKQMALTVICSLLASLLVALTIIPLLSVYLVKEKKQSKTFKWILTKYQSLLQFSLAKKWLVLFVTIVMLFASMFLLIVKVPKNYMPNISERAYAFNYELDGKTSYEENRQIMNKTTQQLLEIDGVHNVYTRGDEDNHNRGRFYIQYAPESEMNKSDKEVNKDIQATIDELVPYKSLHIQEGYGDNSSQVQISVSSSSINHLSEKIRSIKEELMLLKGVKEVQSNTTKETKEWIIQYSPDELQSYGFTNEQIDQYVALVLNGVRNININLDGKDKNLHILFPENISKSIDELYKIPLKNETTITLEDVSSLKQVTTEDNRIRGNGQYEYLLTIFTSSEMREEVVEELGEYISETNDSGVTLAFAGTEHKQETAFSNLILAAAVAFSLVFLILTLQFNHLRQPFLIMLCLPFCLIGVSFGFILTGRTFDIMAMIGVVMIIGIAVNNSIIFIDFVNKNRHYCNSTRTALLEAAKARFRPIITTTITTLGGLIPMFIGGTSSSDFQTPIATAVIFGLLFSVWTSLILLPVFYEIFERRGRIDKIDSIRIDEINKINV